MHSNAILVLSLLILFIFLRPKDDFIRVLKEKHHGQQALNLSSCPEEEDEGEKEKKPHCLGCHLKSCPMAAGSHMTGMGLRGGIRKPRVSGKLL